MIIWKKVSYFLLKLPWSTYTCVLKYFVTYLCSYIQDVSVLVTLICTDRCSEQLKVNFSSTKTLRYQ